jgi:hypothetical protein
MQEQLVLRSAGSILDSTNFKNMLVVFDGASSYISRQGTVIASTGTDVGAGVLNGIVIGQAYTAGQIGAPWIAEFICYNKTLTAQEIADVETYFTNKWGTS